MTLLPLGILKASFRLLSLNRNVNLLNVKFDAPQSVDVREIVKMEEGRGKKEEIPTPTTTSTPLLLFIFTNSFLI